MMRALIYLYIPSLRSNTMPEKNIKNICFPCKVVVYQTDNGKKGIVI